LTETLRENKEFFKNQIDNSIGHVKDMLKNIDSYFLGEDLIENLEKCKKDFLEKYTMEILLGENHTQWVDAQIAKLQDIVRKTKEYIILVKTELTDNLDIQTLKAFIDVLPDGALETKKKIQKIIELFENLEKEFKNPNANVKVIKQYLNNFPKDLCNIKYYKKMQQYAEILNTIEKCAFDNSSDIEILKKYLKEVPSEYHGIIRKIKQKLLEQKTFEVKKQIEVEQIFKEENLKVTKKEEMLEKIEAIFGKLKNINLKLAEEKKQLIQEAKETDDILRVELIFEDLKFSYIKARTIYVQTEVLKNDLKMYETFAEEVGMKSEFNDLMQMDILHKETVDDFIKMLLDRKRQIMEQEIRKVSVDKFIRKIRELGYSVVEEGLMERLSKGEIVEIRTPFGEDYILRIKYENDGIKIMFVRYVEDEGSLSEYEKHKDISIAKKWCSDYDKIKQLLSQEGIVIEDKQRIEPEMRFYYLKKEKMEYTKRHQNIKNNDMQHRQRSV
jgi:DNA-binding transcriptional ArsR family regulator